MSRRPRPRRAPQRVRGLSVWLIALLVAFVATVQIRSQAEVERSLVGVDATSLAFLIDDLHSANDTPASEKADLTRLRASSQSGQTGAADQALTDEASASAPSTAWCPCRDPAPGCRPTPPARPPVTSR